jgi:predicted permease
MEALWTEFRMALRRVAGRPAYSAGICAVLALGIGANTVIFSVLDRAMFRGPPGVRQASSVARLNQEYIAPQTKENRVREVFSDPEFRLIRSAVAGRAQAAAYRANRASLDLSRGSQEVTATYVTGPYFDLLGQSLAVGRAFDQAESEGLGSTVAIISHRLWQEHFAGSLAALGSRLLVDGAPYIVVGIAAPRFVGTAPSPSDIWIPASSTAGRDSSMAARPYDLRLRILVKPYDFTHGQATAQAITLALRSPSVVGDERATAKLEPLTSAIDARDRGKTVPLLWLLAAATAVTLVITCANVGSLMATQARRRQHETAVRRALGAPRWRLVWSVAADAVIVALAGSACAIAVSAIGERVLGRLVLPGLSWDGAAAIEGRTVAFVLAVFVPIAGVLSVFGWVGQRSSISTLLATQRGTNRRGVFARRFTLALQAALSFAVTIAALLFSWSAWRVAHANTGFNAPDVLSLTASPTVAARAGHREIVDALARDLAQVPGVQAVALSGSPPVQALVSTRAFPEAVNSSRDESGELIATSAISPPYLKTMGIGLIAGRDFTSDDISGNEPVVLVSELYAMHHWGSASVIGHCVRVGEPTSACRRVIGVTRDVIAMRLLDEPA